MIRLTIPLVLASALVPVAGCQPAAPPQPAASTRPVVGPAEASHDAHEGHDHAGHDHDAKRQGSTAEPAAAEAGDGDHEGHHHPESLADLVGELDRLVGTVREGMEAGVSEKADSAVHEFGHLVEDVEALAKKAELPADVQEAVVKAGAALFESFDKLDQAIHGGGDVAAAWKEQGEGIDAAMKTLKDAVAK